MGRPRYKEMDGRRHSWTLAASSRTLTYGFQETPGDATYLTLLQLGYEATSVNYLKITASATTNAVVIAPIGSDADIDLTISPKGGGSVTVTGVSLSGSAASTTNTTWEVDNGTTHSSLILSASTTGSTGFSLTLKAASMAAARTVTLPDPGGADSVCYIALAQTLTNKTLTTPTIGSFTNATHDHSNAAGGGALAAATAFSGTTANTFKVNSDSATGTITIEPTVGGTDHTITLTNTTTTAARTVTLPDSTTTLAGLATTQTFAAVQTISLNNATTNAVTDVLVLKHLTTGTAAAGIGVGLTFQLEDATGNDDQAASIDVAYTTATHASEDADIIISTMLAGTVTAALTFDSSAQEIVIGRDATDANGMHALRIWPLTTAKGSLLIQPTDNTGDDTITITNGNTSGDITITLPISTTTLLGKDITGQAGYLQLDGSSDGAIKIAPITTGTGTTTIQNSNTSAVTITLPDATCTLVGTAATNTFTAAQTVAINDASNTSVTDVLQLNHTTSGSPGAGIGLGIGVIIENDTDATTEVARIDFVTTNDGTKTTLDTDVLIKTMADGAELTALHIDASAGEIVIGSSTTDSAGFNKLKLMPLTASKGSLQLVATDNTDDVVVTITNAAHATAGRTYTIPDCGAAANFVMSQAAQTIAGATTFSGGVLTTALTGSDSSLGISGQAGSGGNGGTIAVLSGSGDGAGNDGGAIAMSTGGGAAHTTGTGGDSGAWAIASGAAGTATTGTGGASGTVTINSAAGGAATGDTSTGGASGALSISTGTGGAANHASACTGGVGGDFAIAAGVGGASNNAASTGGDGGSITIYAGSGGASSSGTGGDGGDVTVRAGAGPNSGTAGSISIGATNAAAIGIGRAGVTTTLTGQLEVAADDHLILLQGTGYIQINADTSGALKFLPTATTTSTVTITTASCAAGRTYTIPEAGAAASFVMTAGTQALSGTDTHTGTLDISGATVTYRAILNADVGAAAAIVRSKLAEDALAIYGIPFQYLRNDDGTIMDATGGAGLFKITANGWGTGWLVIDGEAASGNTKTDTLQFEFVLPPEYMSAGDVRLVVHAKENVGAATTSTTLSAEVYESDGQGSVGSDLYNAFDVTDITPTWQACTAVVTAAGLVAGDRLIVLVRVVTNDGGGAVGTVARIGKVQMLADIRG